MQKYILIIAFIFSGFAAKSQIFVQGALTKSLVEQSIEGGNTSSSIGFDLQIGKFVTNQKMRSLKISLRLGRNEVINDQVYSVYNSTTMSYDQFNKKQNISSSVISIGYERKKCFGHTEFDDPWQYYNILSYQFSIVNVTDKFGDPSANTKLFDYTDHNGTHMSFFDISFGLGMARKVSLKTYLYAEVRAFGPLLDTELYSGAGINCNFGIRQFIR